MAPWPETPRRINLARGRRRNDRRFATLRKAGLGQVCMWLAQGLIDAATQRAVALGMHRQTVLRAAVEVGFRHLRTSDVIRTEQKWHGVIGFPVAPRYPGERFVRPEKGFDIGAWSRAHRGRTNGRQPSGRTPGVPKPDRAPAGGGAVPSSLLARSGDPEPGGA